MFTTDRQHELMLQQQQQQQSENTNGADSSSNLTAKAAAAAASPPAEGLQGLLAAYSSESEDEQPGDKPDGNEITNGVGCKMLQQVAGSAAVDTDNVKKGTTILLPSAAELLEGSHQAIFANEQQQQQLQQEQPPEMDAFYAGGINSSHCQGGWV
jgi:hypothetical protein